MEAQAEKARIDAAVEEKKAIRERHLAHVKAAKGFTDELREGLTNPSSNQSVSFQAFQGRVLEILDGVLQAYAAKEAEAGRFNEDAQGAVDCMMSFDRLGSQANWPASHVSQMSTIRHLQQATSDLNDRSNRQMSTNIQLAQSVLELQQQLQLQFDQMKPFKTNGLVETDHKLTHQYNINSHSASSQSAGDNIMSEPAQQTNQPIAPRSTSRFAGLDAEQRQVEVATAPPHEQTVQGSVPPPRASAPTHGRTSIATITKAPEEGQTTPLVTTAQLTPSSSSHSNAVNVPSAPTPPEDTFSPALIQPVTTSSSIGAPHAEGTAQPVVPKATVVANTPHAEGAADNDVPKATEVADQSREESQATVTKAPGMAQVSWGDDSNDNPIAPDSTWEEPAPTVTTNTAGNGGRLPTSSNSRQQPIQSSGQHYRQSGPNAGRPYTSQQQLEPGNINRRNGYNNQGRQNNSASTTGQGSANNYRQNTTRSSPPRAGGPGQQRGSAGNGPGNGVRTDGRRQQAGASANGQVQNAWDNGRPANQDSAPVARGQDAWGDDSSTQNKPAQPKHVLVSVVDSDGFTKAEGRTARQRRKEAAQRAQQFEARKG